MKISASFQGTDKVTLDRLKNAVSKILAGLRVQMDKEMISLTTYIVSEKLSGQVLHRRSGTLSDSIHPIPAEQSGDVVTGGVEGAGGPAFYGVFFEYGGKGPYPIRPVNKKALAFFPSDGMTPRNATVTAEISRRISSGNASVRASAQGKFRDLGGVVVRSVIHPAIPKLPFMVPSLAENREKITVNLRQAAIRALQSR